MATPSKWPEHLVDARGVFSFITQHLGIAGHSVTTRKHHLAFSMEQAVERARQAGRLRRYVVKHPTTGEVVGYGYSRDELKSFLSTNQASIDREMSRDSA